MDLNSVKRREKATVNDDLKFGLTVLAVLGVVIFATTQAISMDMSIADLVVQLVQHAIDLLRHLFTQVRAENPPLNLA